jgi:hypothetical protein
MKTFLLATAAITLAGTAAWAVDDDERHTRVRFAGGPAMAWNQDGTVIEIRGEDGERTIHMQGSGSDATLNVNGQDIQIRGNSVFIDGQAVETNGAAMIIIDGDEIRVVNDGDTHRFDGQFELHMAERAEEMAWMAADMENFRFEFDSEGIEADVMASLEAALAGLEGDAMSDHDSRRWTQMTEAEREEAREAMEGAREEIREAMETMRTEMRDAHRFSEDEMRRVRVEMHHATGEAEHAAREEARLHRDMAREEARAHRDEAHAARNEAEAAREEAHAARAEAHAERQHVMRWQSAANDSDRVEQSVRVERSDDGRRQVWVNDEEQTGDDLVSWLNQLEAERLAGGPAGDSRHVERRVIRLDRPDGSSREVDLSGRRVIVLRSDDDQNGERVFEFEIEDNDDDSED